MATPFGIMPGRGPGPGEDRTIMVGETPKWVSYDEAATLLGLSPEATMRVALRRSWPRRAHPTDGTQVAVPATPPDDEESEDVTTLGHGDARALLGYLELRVEQLTEELAEARTEMRGVRYEADSLRAEAARSQVFAALVEAERARSAEIKAERDRLADELAHDRRPWIGRLVHALTAGSHRAVRGR
jgi:hypothetical protein